MILETILALFLGILVGTFTGLFPGIHINLVAVGLLALVSAGKFSGIEGIVLAVFVVAMAVTHTFIDFIPSVFLGAPEEDSYLAVLPGHELLKEGKGYEAVVLTLYGSLIALPIILVFSFVFVLFLDSFYGSISFLIPYILFFASLYLIFREENWIGAGVVFALAGFLGLLTFNISVREPLLPLLTGLFGVSALIVSLKTRVQIPKQEIVSLRKIKLERKSFWKSVFAIALMAPLSSFLPGMGSGQAAVVASEISGNAGDDKKPFLFLVGAINTIVMALSFVALYVIGKTRTGTAVAIQKILGEFSFGDLFLVLNVVIFSGIIAFFIGILLTRFFALWIGEINYSKLSYVVLGILFVVNLILSNWIGLIVLVTASALGVFCIVSNVRRINLMGCLLVPTIVFYLVG